MTVVLYVLGLLGVMFGAFVFTNAKSAVHEIEGLIALVFAAVCVGSATIALGLARLTDSRQPVNAQRPPQQDEQMPRFEQR